MKFYRLREEDRQYLYALLYATGLILFWRGIWEVSYEIPLLENVYFVLFVGLFVLTITGYIYREYDVFGQRAKAATRAVQEAVTQTKRGHPHQIYYYDDLKGDDHLINPKLIKKIESDFLIINQKGHEFFVPILRVTKVTKNKEILWKR
jgi:hypothetical protein